MSKKIEGKELPIKDIFTEKYEFIIPSYQRPYAWTTEQAGELLDDLESCMKDDYYFLGSIVLTKEENNPVAKVIDGQQRLTSVTILLSVLCYILEEKGKDKKNLQKYIIAEGDEYTEIETKPRLTLRKRDQKFFFDYVQGLNFKDLWDQDSQQLESEAQINIRNNSKLFYDKLVKFDEDTLREFIKFLLNSCYLVIISTINEQSAFRVFSVMNNRGLDLLPTDIFKADIIGDSDNQDDDISKWESLEVMLGRDEFNNLFSYIRMIYDKSKSRRALVQEFQEQVLTKIDKKYFIQNDLVPYANRLDIINKCTYQAVTNAKSINQYLSCLNRVGNSDWKPVAIRFLKEYGQDPEFVNLFFQKLERLAAMMLVCGENINYRITRYAKILRELDNSSKTLSEIELSDDEKANFLSNLSGDVYNMTSTRKSYIILRLDQFMSDNSASYEPSFLTIEHVLPQTVASDSKWIEWWADEDERKQWVHKLGNLIPLNRARNSSAQNYDFCDKKEKYFTGKENISAYVLTSQVLLEEKWTPEIVKNRQNRCLDIFKEKWQLA